MNTTTVSSRDLAAARNAAARKANGKDPITASQASTLETMTSYPDKADHATLVEQTRYDHDGPRFCEFDACPIPGAAMEPYNAGPFHHSCNWKHDLAVAVADAAL